MKKSNFTSPVYTVVAVDIDDIVAQKTNPNQMTAKSWDALQQSINNGGYVAPVQIAPNADYDPTTEGMPKPSLIEHTDKNNDAVENTEAGMQATIIVKVMKMEFVLCMKIMRKLYNAGIKYAS